MANLVKRGNNYYIYYWDAFNSKMKGFSLRTSNEVRAKALLKDWKENHRDYRLQAMYKSQYRLSAGLEKFLLNKSLSKTYIRNCRHAIALVIEIIGDHYLQSLTREHYNQINQLLLRKKATRANWTKEKTTITKLDRDITQNTRNTYASILRSIFNWFVDQEIIDRHYIHKQKPERKNINIIPPDDLKKIINAATGEHRFIILFLLLTGRRVSEILYIRNNQIDLKAGTMDLYIGKTKKHVTLPIIAPLRKLLDARNTKSEFLIQYHSYSAIRSYWRRLMQQLDMTYTIHQLRKTCATYLANSGVNILYVQAYLTHSDQKTTLTHYTQIQLQQMKTEIETLADFSALITDH